MSGGGKGFSARKFWLNRSNGGSAGCTLWDFKIISFARDMRTGK
jgi:hypothetical protein